MRASSVALSALLLLAGCQRTPPAEPAAASASGSGPAAEASAGSAAPAPTAIAPVQQALAAVLALPVHSAPRVSPPPDDGNPLAVDEGPLDPNGAAQLREAVTALPDGPEREASLAALRELALAAAERTPSPIHRISFLRMAYELGPDAQLALQLIPEIEAAADLIAVNRPQEAATLLELISLRQIPGLPITDEMVARAGERGREVLYPIFVTNFLFRYDDKHLEDDIAELDGFTSENRVATFRQTDPEERKLAIARWIYRISERPAVTEVPDFAAEEGICADVSVPCEFPLDAAIRILYRMNDIEAAHAARLGHPLVYVNEL